MVTTQRLNDSSTTTQSVIAFDYDSSGKQDHLLYYTPGSGDVTIIKNNHDGTFTKVYPTGTTTAPGFGAGNVDFTQASDRVIAFDYTGQGKLDHLVCYRSGTGLVSILETQKPASFKAVFTSTNGIGDYSMTDVHDQIIAYDYGTGHLDHLVCYRPGSGTVWILQNQSGTFSRVYASCENGAGSGIGQYDLSNPNDRIIAYDYSGSGRMDHLVCYRPGRGAIFILENKNGTFDANIYAQGDPGSGISKFDLSQTQDRILAYDYVGTGAQDHLLCYRPGTGLVYILASNKASSNATFSPVYPADPNSPPNGIGGYNLQSISDDGFTFDYDSTGKQNYLVFYRPGDNWMPVTTN